LIRILPSNFLPNSFFSREQEFTSSDLVVHGTKRMFYSFLGINTTNISIYQIISSQHHDKKRENTISITVIRIPNISSISHWHWGLYHVDIFKTYSYYPWVERNIIFWSLLFHHRSFYRQFGRSKASTECWDEGKYHPILKLISYPFPS